LVDVSDDVLPSSPLGKEVKALTDWASTTSTGDRGDVPFPTSGKAWSQVSVSADDCASKQCPFYRPENGPMCFAERTRMAAAEANIIVVNQAYLAMAMKHPKLLPETVGAIVVDEAHELPTVVAHSFGAQLTERR